jgi:hypothetical protein
MGWLLARGTPRNTEGSNTSQALRVITDWGCLTRSFTNFTSHVFALSSPDAGHGRESTPWAHTSPESLQCDFLKVRKISLLAMSLEGTKCTRFIFTFRGFHPAIIKAIFTLFQ